MTAYPAILLLGPTSSGKTPLGSHMENRGICGRVCYHFDFGSRLRHIAESDGKVRGYKAAEVRIIKESLFTGRLLENETFFVAEKVLRMFIKECSVGPESLIILNGLPRHAGQAEDMEDIVDIQAVISLICSAPSIAERIRTNVEGDRTGRQDDSLGLIRIKLETFRTRTLPLIQYYRDMDVPVVEFETGPQTSADVVYKTVTASLRI